MCKICAILQLEISLPRTPDNFELVSSAPTKPPGNVRANETSSTSIQMKWDDVPEADQNGIIRGYRITYKGDNSWSRNESTVNVGDAEIKTKSLKNLNPNTVYNICVSAYANKGHGPASCVSAATPEDST